MRHAITWPKLPRLPIKLLQCRYLFVLFYSCNFCSCFLLQQKVKFWFATGGAGFCISKALALKMIPVAGWVRTFFHIAILSRSTALCLLAWSMNADRYNLLIPACWLVRCTCSRGYRTIASLFRFMRLARFQVRFMCFENFDELQRWLIRFTILFTFAAIHALRAQQPLKRFYTVFFLQIPLVNILFISNHVLFHFFVRRFIEFQVTAIYFT